MEDFLETLDLVAHFHKFRRGSFFDEFIRLSSQFPVLDWGFSADRTEIKKPNLDADSGCRQNAAACLRG